MRIRKVKKSDVLLIAELELNLQESSGWSVQQLEAAHTQQSLNYLIEKKETGEVVGYVFSQYVMDEAEIHIVGIHKNIQRKGLGTKLLTHLLSKLAQRSIKQVFLEVRQSNEPAISLYQKLGFEKVGLRKNYYKKQTISDSRAKTVFEDAIIMQKKLALNTP